MTKINSVVIYFLWRNRDMKKTLKLALAGVVLCGGVASTAMADTYQSAEEAQTRLHMLAKYFRDNGLATFANLNGNGNNDTAHGKNRDNLDGMEYGQLFNNPDGEATIYCVENGNWAVHQMKPTLVGTSAVSGDNLWYDGLGHQMVPKAIKAIQEARLNGKDMVSVPYVETTKEVENAREGKPLETKGSLLLIGSRDLLGRKNDTGSKFFCATRYIEPAGTDYDDAGSSWQGREGTEPGPRGHHHHKHHKKHHGHKHHHHKHHEKAAMAGDKE